MAVMLPVAASLMVGDGAERDYSSPAHPQTLKPQAADQNSRSAPDSSSAAGESGTRQTSQEIDQKREGQGSSDDHESAKTARTRSKSSLSSGSDVQLSPTADQFAAVFADAVSAARVAAQPPAQTSSDAGAASAAQLVQADTSAAASAVTRGAVASSALIDSAGAPKAATADQAAAPVQPTASPLATATATTANDPVPSATVVAVSAQADSAAAPRAHAKTASPAAATTQTSVKATPIFAANQSAVPASTLQAKSETAAAPASPTVQTPAIATASNSIADNPYASAAAAASTGTSATASVSASPALSAIAALAGAPTPVAASPKSASNAPLFGKVTFQSLDVSSAAPQGAAVTSKSSDTAAGSESDSDADADSGRGSASGAEDRRVVKDIQDGSGSDSSAAASILPQAPQSDSPAPAADPDVPVAQSSLQERIDIARQLADKISASGSLSGASAAGATQKLTVDISPQHWGRMQITLTQSAADAAGNSQATATIVTESESARQALLGQVKALRDSLQAGGVKIDKIDIVTAPKGSMPGMSADSVVAGAAGASSGSLAGGAQQQSQQHHPHSGGRFEFAGSPSGTGSDASSSQGGRRQFAGFDQEAGAASYQNTGLSSPNGTGSAGMDAPALIANRADINTDSGVNVLA